MGMYHCSKCDRYCDDNSNPAGSHPTDKCAMICDECQSFPEWWEMGTHDQTTLTCPDCGSTHVKKAERKTFNSTRARYVCGECHSVSQEWTA